ncbi:SMI1/KNR4 family protein [uncultured Enterococcus sp.]|uniref:SMI1/KNR4 family protein n=1 Tax=uncultured Enterococcus sp. TaxID=167972 RepID=UPI002AA78FBB|nr:SMI1/KNR4 family protein [uncultured Enterococcus sp.]
MDNELARFAEMSTTKKRGVTAASIQETEQLLTVTLDEQYKALLQLVNAPEYGEWRFYPIKDEQNLRKTMDDVVRNTKLKRAEGLPAEFVVIAENGTGNFLCMKSGESAIYHNDHEEECPMKVFQDLKAFIHQAETFES